MLSYFTLRKLLALTLLLAIAVSYAGPAAANNQSRSLVDATQRGTRVQASTLKASSFAPWPLANGLTATGSLNSTDDYYMWYIDVDVGAHSMRSILTFSSPSADFDLYGAFGYQPTRTYYDWSGTRGGGEDESYLNPLNGRWYIMVYSYSGNGSYSLTVTIEYGNSLINTVFAGSAFIAIGASAFILLMVVALRRRRTSGHSGTRQSYQQPSASQSDVSIPEAIRIRLPPTPSAKCGSCGASLVVGEDYCWNCGAKITAPISRTAKPPGRTVTELRRGICMVCGLSLAKGDEMLSCPHCGNLAHRNHLLEWLHVKDYCPLCRKHLDQRDLIM
jgi:predicted RNA-binding Zn-ribbon protein involved in translation (DUF1610 family)